MCFKKNVLWSLLLAITYFKEINGADDAYNVLHRDGSFEFGYNTPDSYHYADGNRKNVVRGEFGGRNPGTGAIDSTVYTAGPRGFRPRGKNIVRKYDLNQNSPRAIGSRDDPYYDPFEDPSYSFGFKTRTYTRQESANRIGNVNGRYSYLDDVGERHNVEYIAGKNTGFHVKTPFPDSNPRAYGPLYFTGRGRPIPRGRTSIQRGLDGSYRFVSAGPDQRRTETSDSTGHVRGSYTYLDDKGVQHSVHYIAGPETGYRVLKNVKGPHLPTVFPFGRPGIVPPDFYDYLLGPDGDVFDTAANGRPVKPGDKKKKPSYDDFGNAIDIGKDDYDKFGSDFGSSGGSKKPYGGTGSNSRPSGSSRPGGSRPRPGDGGSTPSFDDSDDDIGDLFGNDGGSRGPGASPKPPKPGGLPLPSSTQRPGASGEDDDDGDDGSYKPSGEDGIYKPVGGDKRPYSESSTTLRPGSTTPSPTGDFSGYDYGRPGGKPSPGGLRPPSSTAGGLPGYEGSLDSSEFGPGPSGSGTGLYGSESGRPYGSGDKGGGHVLQVGGKPCKPCKGTIVTNVGNKPFHVPPGVSVRAHVQSIDLLPVDSNVPSPSEQFNVESNIRTEQLNKASNEVVEDKFKNNKDKPEESSKTSTTSSNEDLISTTTTTWAPDSSNESTTKADR